MGAPQGSEHPRTREPAGWVNFAELAPWKQNPRVNDSAAFAVADSIRRFGFGAPVVARRSDRRIIAGHTRVKASKVLADRWAAASEAKHRAWEAAAALLDDGTANPEHWSQDALHIARTGEIPVRFMELSDSDAALLAVADNKLGELATWEQTLLTDVASAFSADDLTIAGFSSSELADLLSGSFDPDEFQPTDDSGQDKLDKSGLQTLNCTWHSGPYCLLCGGLVQRDRRARASRSS